MPHSIKVGLIGYGSSVHLFHLPFILPNPDLEVYAFLQRAEATHDKTNVETGRHCTVDYPNAKHYRTPEEFLADEKIELVIICTGHETHYEFAEGALRSGKHVVVEKPFTLTSAEADSLISLSQQQNRILTIFQNRRYDSDFRTLENYIAQDIFGEIIEFENHYSVKDPWWIQSSSTAPKPGDGMLYRLGSHSIDQTVQLFGLPEKITAFTRNLPVENGSEDFFLILLQYEGRRLISTIKTSVVVPMEQAFIPKFVLRGTRGSFTKNGEDPQVEHLLSGIKPTDPMFGVEPVYYHGYLTTRKNIDRSRFQSPSLETEIKFDGKVPSKRGSYMDYYKDLVAAIRREKDLVVKPEESRNVIRLIELAKESAEKGLTVSWR